eukprot:m.105973 g.105973  ORF g.105973 m.105973 type:complete len:54 (-) comp16886_c0_seq3:31-192(-)
MAPQLNPVHKQSPNTVFTHDCTKDIMIKAKVFKRFCAQSKKSVPQRQTKVSTS